MKHRMDGMPVIGYADFVCKLTYAQARKKSSTSSSNGIALVRDIFEQALSQMNRSAVERLETKGSSICPLFM